MDDRSGPRLSSWSASDGYPIHVASWTVNQHVEKRGRIVVLHGVQSHGGWYHNLGRILSGRGYETHFPDRRGSGANVIARGHVSSKKRLLDDVAEYLAATKHDGPSLPMTLVGISWSGKLAVITAARRPDLVSNLVMICPGLCPRVDVTRSERVQIALASLFRPTKPFPIPLSDPRLFTDDEAGQRFIAEDPLALKSASARLLAASKFIDFEVTKIPSKVHQPTMLMLAGQDRIVDNEKTIRYFHRLGTRDRTLLTYDDGHHTLEFEEDPDRYANDLADWLDSRLEPSKSRT